MSRIYKVFHSLAGLAVSLLFLLPLFWVLIVSLRAPGLPQPRTIEWWPSTPHWQNYRDIFTIVPMARYALNSLFVVSLAVPVTLLMASLAGFAIAQSPEQERRQLVLLSIALLVIPAASVWLFRFQMLRWLGLLDTLWALIIPSLAASSPLFVLLFYWSFRHIPSEMFEAARLDGAGPWTMWRSIAMPLSLPTSVTVVVLSFVMYWSDFVSPVLYLYDPEDYTLPVALQLLNQLDSTNWPLLMAATAVMTTPVVLLFAFLQRFFLHDLSPANLIGRSG